MIIMLDIKGLLFVDRRLKVNTTKRLHIFLVTFNEDAKNLLRNLKIISSGFVELK